MIKRDILVVDLLALPNSLDRLRYIGPLEEKSDGFVISYPFTPLPIVIKDSLSLEKPIYYLEPPPLLKGPITPLALST